MANIDLSKLPPQLQSALFQASKQTGQQPTAGGLPIDQSTPQMEMPAPGSFKDDPQGAMKFIAQRFSQQLSQGPQGELMMEKPSDVPLFRMLGRTKTVPVDSPDYFSTVKQAGLEHLLPNNLPRTPEGTPFVSADTLERIRQTSSASMKPKATPNPLLNEAMKVKAEEMYGKDHPRYKSLAAAIDSGALTPENLSEFNNALITTSKTLDIFKGEDGRMYKYDRTNESVVPIVGAAGGVLSQFNPLELSFVKKEMEGFDSDALVKDVKLQVGQLGRVSALVESRNPSALGIMASNIAKGLGREAGALTEGDIARATGSQQLGDRWKRYWSKHTTGQLTESDINDFRGLMQDINKTAQRQLASVAKERAGRLSKVLKRPVEDLIPVISYGVEFMQGEEKADPTQPSITTAARVPVKQAGQTKSGTKYRVIP